MTAPLPAQRRRRLAIFSRYPLNDQYDLAAEFKGMLQTLASRNDVLHLSLRGAQPPSDIPPGVTVDELPLRIHRKSPGNILLGSMLMYLLMPLIVCRLRRFRPDGVFISEILPLVGPILKLSGAPVATAYGDWHVHNFLGRKSWSKPFIKLTEALERWEVRTVDGFFCRAAAAREKLASLGMDRNRIRVVYDAPDPRAFFPQDQSALRQRLGFAPDDTVLLYHGIMHQGKGLDALVRWTADLHKSDPKIGLILVGSGPELEPLKQLAAELGLGARAHFTGWLKTIHEVGAYCNAADICIAMRTGAESNVHIVPGALLHSMACRKIVVGPRLPGISEILRHGENGFMFSPDDGEDFKRLIRELQSKRNDWPAVAEQAYRDIVKDYAVPAAAAQYAEAIEFFADAQKR